jgi:hypothetical protein
MDTKTIPGMLIPAFDEAVVQAIHEFHARNADTVDDQATETPQHVLIGLRNDGGLIYRRVVTCTIREFVHLSRTLRSLGLEDEIAAGRKQGFDALFGRPSQEGHRHSDARTPQERRDGRQHKRHEWHRA